MDRQGSAARKGSLESDLRDFDDEHVIMPRLLFQQTFLRDLGRQIGQKNIAKLSE